MLIYLTEPDGERTVVNPDYIIRARANPETGGAILTLAEPEREGVRRGGPPGLRVKESLADVVERAYEASKGESPREVPRP
jgi:uncharacterized protein YlzI (FlbEa/FlbD family)